MKFGVLGPLLVERPDGSGVPIPSHRQRAVLALLLIANGRTVSTDRLIDAVWGEDLPANPASTLQNSITHLRKALEPDRQRSTPPTILLSSDSGYRLDLDHHYIDATIFEQTSAEARSLFDAEQAAEALDLVDSALQEWRGAAYADFLTESFAHGERERLAELRVEAAELRVDCVRLAYGPEAAIPELEFLVAEHPYRESFWAKLMIAHYQAGRQADALRTYQRATSALADELGLDASPDLRALEQRILQQDAELARHRGDTATDNLPAPTSNLVGRQEELELIKGVLTESRLVTLLGPGGSGKTRLALEVARDLIAQADGYSDGIWLVRLDDLGDPFLLEPSIGAVLRMPESAEHTVRDTLIKHLHPQHMLLILDNCEHLVEHVASLVGDLIVRCPGLTILATSQIPLNLSAEQRIDVPPLGVPGRESSAFVELEAAPAVELFIERAAQLNPQRRFDNTDVQAIANIVHTLDGLPLAIELAAARTTSLTPSEIARLLADRFALLTGGTDDAPARQQTLGSAVTWSYNLLESEEQVFFAEIAVFAGGLDIEAAAQVTGRSETDTLNLLDRMLSSSLIQRQSDARGVSRFRLLETLRLYGLQRLAVDIKTSHRLRQSHAECFAQKAVRLERQLQGPKQGQAFAALAADEDNFRGAMAWSLEAGVADPRRLQHGVRIAAGLGRFWDWQGALAEANTWLTRFFDAVSADDDPPADFAILIGWHAFFLSELDLTQPGVNLAELALAVAVTAKDLPSQAALLTGKAMALRLDDQPEAALSVGTQARALAEQLNEKWLISLAHNHDALAHLDLADLDAASDAADRAQTGFDEIGDRRATAWGMTVQAQVMLARGDNGAGRDMARTAMAVSAEAKDGRNAAWASEIAAAAARADNDPDGADELEAEAAALLSARGMPRAPWQQR